MTENKNMKVNEDENDYNMIAEYCTKRLRRCHKYLQDTRVYADLLEFVKYLHSNPVLLTICLIIITIVFVPLLLFIIFAVVNATFAFVGFIIIVVTILLIGASILACVLFCTVTTLGTICLLIFFMYHSINYMNNFVKSLLLQ